MRWHQEQTHIEGPAADCGIGGRLMITLDRQRGRSLKAEQGVVLYILLASIIPLVLLTGAAAMTMTGRNNRMMDEIVYEKALLAAESGIDEAVYLGATGSLLSGGNFERDLGNGYYCFIEPTYLKTDSKDNDGDTLVDEADENLFQIVVTGSYRGVKRRLVAYMGPTPGLEMPEGSMVVTATPKKIEVEKNSMVSGLDVTPGDVTPIFGKKHKTKGKGALVDTSIPGIVGAGTTTLSDLQYATEIKSGSQINGDGSVTWGASTDIASGKETNGGTASLAVAPMGYDLNQFIDAIRSTAGTVVTQKEVKTPAWGDATTGDYRTIFRNGKLKLEAGGRGAGILVVTGELKIEGGFRFDGVIIALGEVEFEHGAVLNGSLIVGPGIGDYDDHGDDHGDEHGDGGIEIQLEEGSTIQYSSEIIQQVQTLVPGKFVIFNGWQEISAN